MTTTWAWWSSRSIAADAMRSSRKSGYHSSRARFDGRRYDAADQRIEEAPSQDTARLHPENDQMTDHEALDWIRENEHGIYSSSRFDNLYVSAGAPIAAARVRGETDGRLAQLSTIANNAYCLHDDWRNLLMMITRVEWSRQQVDAGHLDGHTWASFTALDVEHFHIQLRSAFDHLARIVIAHSLRPGQTPSKSYNLLSKWAAENPARAARLLGERLANVIAGSRSLFLARKRIRESIVHRGSNSIVFSPTAGIAFQVYAQGIQHSLLRDLGNLMYNENVVDFRRYVCDTLLRFWSLAEAVAVETFSKFNLPQIGLGDGAMAYHPGLDVLRHWGTGASLPSYGSPQR